MRRLAAGELPADEIIASLEHLGTCDACARLGAAAAEPDMFALRDEFESADVPQRPRWIYPLAAAIAIAALLLFVVMTVNRQHPAPMKTPPVVHAPPTQTAPPVIVHVRDPEWQQLVARAVESGELPFPRDLDALRGAHDVVRGENGEDERVAPAGIVVEDARPLFTWPARNDATYLVSVFDGERAIAHSESLSVPRWRPARELPRGRMLTWQVEVPRREMTEVIPAPPAPPAMFRITSERDHRELARAKGGDEDDLLLAVLYARSGLRDEARDALRRAAAKGDPAARPLLERNFPNTAKKTR
ncbi:MAG TPA: hypothetical protein VN181_09530 [Thermoanaerobaculia bacterium]|nr:hypothetical protein [Thermoanaerobaculia bacterium]